METATEFKIVSNKVSGGTMVLILEADTYAELDVPAAKTFAILEAEKAGLSGAAISASPAPYPVDADGNSNDDVHMGKVRVVAYRREITVRRRL